MSMTNEFSFPTPGRSLPAGGNGDRPSAAGSLVSCVAILAGSALLGLAGGLVWAQIAPQAVYVVVSRGSADVVNPETTAFIAADAAYCLAGLIGGLIIGLVSYRLAVRRYGPWPMAAVLVGGLVAAGIARWVGEHTGLASFDNQLLTSNVGTHLQAPLGLAGDTSATAFPTMASLPAVAFWPLAAGLVAGGLSLLVVLRERREAAVYAEVVTPSPMHTGHQQPGPQQPGSPPA